jgi:hypothetical protein
MEVDPGWEATFLNWPLLAMAHHRLGHGDEARKWIDKAVRETPKDAARLVKWWDWEEYQLFRREA